MIMTPTTRPPNIARRGRYTRLPNPPKTIDMARFHHVTRAHSILDCRYEDDPSTLVGAGGYLLYAPGIHRGFTVPACMVAFGVEAAEIIQANGYSIAEVGKPPDFVLEIASEATGSATTQSSAGYTSACARANTGDSTPPADCITTPRSRATFC